MSPMRDPHRGVGCMHNAHKHNTTNHNQKSQHEKRVRSEAWGWTAELNAALDCAVR